MPEATIVSDPHIMMGKPVIAGTRITVELILRKLGEGATHKDLRFAASLCLVLNLLLCYAVCSMTSLNGKPCLTSIIVTEPSPSWLKWSNSSAT